MPSQAGLLRGDPGGLLSPLMLAGYVAWAAVAWEPLSHLSRLPALDARATLGLGALFASLMLFVAHGLLGGRSMLRAERVVVLANAVTAVLACWAFAGRIYHLTPALLVVVGSQAAFSFTPGVLALLLLAMDTALVAALWQAWSGHEVLHLLVAYGGLQAFAVFAARYARQAEEARDEALRMNAELVATRHLLEAGAQAEERLRLSRELHDIAGHKLTALKMQLALQVRQAPPGAAPAGLNECERLADGLLSDIRGVVSALREHDGVNLHRALRALDPGLPSPAISFELDDGLRIADMRRAQALLRCAQEGLANALRHSAASRVRVRLMREADGVVLTVEDDGAGRSSTLRRGNGLRGLHERLAELGGRLELRDRTPAGLMLRAFVPETAAPC